MNLHPIWSSESNGSSGASPDPEIGRGTYAGAVSTIFQELGIPEDYGPSRGLDLQPEATELVTARVMPDGREIRLTPDVAASWQAMSQAASTDHVTLLLISGFRSVAYQRQIIERKLARGDTLDQILRVNAAPGYSEHHTGRAIDIGTPGSPPLEEEFENTEAFRWLQLHGAQYGFSLTYPRFNLHRIIYEPWHWLHRR